MSSISSFFSNSISQLRSKLTPGSLQNFASVFLVTYILNSIFCYVIEQGSNALTTLFIRTCSPHFVSALKIIGKSFGNFSDAGSSGWDARAISVPIIKCFRFSIKYDMHLNR
ncbi:hypothetical protein C1646_759506 [Rhizophagus diaphanus]|nr:hypothetical protein C1646_759506 [Rhizophagus diaphanus] [Rhizophagus sp. MUCL 43196]